MALTVNANKLRGKIAEKGYTISSLASDMNVTRDTMSRYIKDPRAMQLGQIIRLASLLCDSDEEAKSIFLVQDLRETQEGGS